MSQEIAVFARHSRDDIRGVPNNRYRMVEIAAVATVYMTKRSEQVRETLVACNSTKPQTTP